MNFLLPVLGTCLFFISARGMMEKKNTLFEIGTKEMDDKQWLESKVLEMKNLTDQFARELSVRDNGKKLTKSLEEKYNVEKERLEPLIEKYVITADEEKADLLLNDEHAFLEMMPGKWYGYGYRNNLKVKSKISSSQYEGVSFNKAQQKYLAQFIHKKTPYYLGTHENEIDAAIEVNKKCLELGIPLKNPNIEMPETLESELLEIKKRKRNLEKDEQKSFEGDEKNKLNVKQKLNNNYGIAALTENRNVYISKFNKNKTMNEPLTLSFKNVKKLLKTNYLFVVLNDKNEVRVTGYLHSQRRYVKNFRIEENIADVIIDDKNQIVSELIKCGDSTGEVYQTAEPGFRRKGYVPFASIIGKRKFCDYVQVLTEMDDDRNYIVEDEEGQRQKVNYDDLRFTSWGIN